MNIVSCEKIFKLLKWLKKYSQLYFYHESLSCLQLNDLEILLILAVGLKC